jgi:hypothetical protein
LAVSGGETAELAGEVAHGDQRLGMVWSERLRQQIQAKAPTWMDSRVNVNAVGGKQATGSGVGSMAGVGGASSATAWAVSQSDRATILESNMALAE